MLQLLDDRKGTARQNVIQKMHRANAAAQSSSGSMCFRIT